jgi:hypothetical protein
MRIRIPLDPSDASAVNRFILKYLGTRYQPTVRSSVLRLSTSIVRFVGLTIPSYLPACAQVTRVQSIGS